MGRSPSPENDAPRNGRLDGWKEIAAYVGRGVRTAQRWERELGLPVHRLRTGSGEVVYADRAEIDAWLLKQSGASLAREEDGRNGNGQDTNGREGSERGGTARGGRRWLAIGGGAAVTALAAVAIAGWALAVRPDPGGAGNAPSPARGSTPAPALRQPVALAAANNTLVAFGADGRQVWTHPFDVPITEYNAQQPAAFRRLWHVQDIDGDGSSEAIFARNEHADPRLYCFNGDGSVRFAESIDTPVRFGEDACPPVVLTHVFREQRPDFAGTFLVAGRHPINSPGVLRRIDAKGRAAGEYWNNGHVGLVTSAQIGGRWATLVGSAYNETGGAGLAVFFGNIRGSAPATQAANACNGCEAGGPDVYLVLPRSRLQQALGQNAIVNSISIVGPDRLSVDVVVAGTPDAAQDCCGHVYYTLDSGFRVLDAELGASYASLQRAFEAEGRVTADSRFREPGDFYPIRRWTGSGWEIIKGPERSIPRELPHPRSSHLP